MWKFKKQLFESCALDILPVSDLGMFMEADLLYPCLLDSPCIAHGVAQMLSSESWHGFVYGKGEFFLATRFLYFFLPSSRVQTSFFPAELQAWKLSNSRAMCAEKSQVRSAESADLWPQARCQKEGLMSKCFMLQR